MSGKKSVYPIEYLLYNKFMKKFIVTLLSVFLINSASVMADEFSVPVPTEDDVIQSGPDTKYSLVTKLRFDAFQDAELTVPTSILADKMSVKIYKLAPKKTYLEKVKIPNAKIIEYTNGSYDIKFKEVSDVIFSYDRNGDLQSFAKYTNNGKIPFITYHYDTTGTIIGIEVKADRYRSFEYGLDGVLTKYKIDDKVYSANGKMLLRRKNPFF